jgi:hypothetical protein
MKVPNRIFDLVMLALIFAGCQNDRPTAPRPAGIALASRGPLDPALIASGNAIFRMDTDRPHG